MSYGLTEGNGLTVDQVQPGGGGSVATGGSQQGPDLRQQVMHARQPLLVGRQGRESRAPVLRHQTIGLFKGSYRKDPLQQGDGQHLSIAERGLRIRRVPPLGESRVTFQKFVYKAVDLG